MDPVSAPARHVLHPDPDPDGPDLLRNRPVVARALLAARLVRLLDPAAQQHGGFASGAVCVDLDGVPVRPLLVVARCAPPREGVLRRPPILVVETGSFGAPPVDPRAWLQAGVRAVWVVTPRTAAVWTRSGPRVVDGDGVLDVPRWPALRVALRTLWA